MEIAQATLHITGLPMDNLDWTDGLDKLDWTAALIELLPAM